MNETLILIAKILLSVIVGGLIGSERAHHGRNAGMRTHILVCLGAALTSMTSIFVADKLGLGGDVFRIPAQVISGIGFLGTGVIILRGNNMVTGLTTAAGLWTTGSIGVAIGYGYYAGAITATLLFLVSIILFAKLEKKNKSKKVLYIEINDMYKTNAVIKALKEFIGSEINYRIVFPKSKFQGNLGISVICDRDFDKNLDELLDDENVIYAVFEGN